MIKIYISNKDAVMETDDDKLLKALSKKYRARMPGYEYAQAYKQHRWDGYKYFFNEETGKFGAGLSKYITDDLDYLGLTYTVEDSRFTASSRPFSPPGVTLRAYQTALIDKVLERRGSIVQAPTGSGKTLVLAGILNSLSDMRGLIFFTKKQLLYQTYEYLTSLGFDVGRVCGDGTDIKPITLCTIQSVSKIIDSHVQTAEFIIFDEVHEFSMGKLTTAALKSFPFAEYRIGMTATVPKDKYKKLNLVSNLGPVLDDVSTEELMALGFLTPPTINLIKIENKLTLADMELTYPETYDKFIVFNDKRNRTVLKIIEKIQAENASSKTLILVKDLKHVKILKELYPLALTIEGADIITDRQAQIDKFVSQTHGVIIGTVVMQTGIDIPEITHYINARGLKSEIATIQAMGRSLRVHHTKTDVYIYDFLDEGPYIGQHAKKRAIMYKSHGFTVLK